jgi:hypothetical protein
VEKGESHLGTAGWLALGAGVVAFDYLSPETLSHAVDRALECPRSRYAAMGAVAITAAHLLNFIPDQLDPFKYMPSRFSPE